MYKTTLLKGMGEKDADISSFVPKSVIHQVYDKIKEKKENKNE